MRGEPHRSRMAAREGEFDVELFASLDEKLKLVIDDLLWWARALGRAREDEAASPSSS